MYIQTAQTHKNKAKENIKEKHMRPPLLAIHILYNIHIYIYVHTITLDIILRINSWNSSFVSFSIYFVRVFPIFHSCIKVKLTRIYHFRLFGDIYIVRRHNMYERVDRVWVEYLFRIFSPYTFFFCRHIFGADAGYEVLCTILLYKIWYLFYLRLGA